MLWTSVFFQLTTFQQRVIEQILIPNLSRKNAPVYLNEAFKKLRAAQSQKTGASEQEEENNSWFVLFNSTMEFIARNVLLFGVEDKRFLLIASSIRKQILLRALRLHRHSLTGS